MYFYRCDKFAPGVEYVLGSNPDAIYKSVKMQFIGQWRYYLPFSEDAFYRSVKMLFIGQWRCYL